MSAITIAGTALDVTDGGEGEPIPIGNDARAFAGNLRNSVRGQRVTFNFTTSPTSTTVWASISSACANRAQVACSGTILAGASITAALRVSAKYMAGTSPTLVVITGAGEEV